MAAMVFAMLCASCQHLDYKERWESDAVGVMCGIRRASGFTLIELLVVITVIAILAAILLPVFLAAKQHSMQVHCQYNLKQLTLGLLQYKEDNDGRMPNISDWMPPYLSHYHTPTWCGSQGRGLECRVDEGSLWRYVKKRELYLCFQDRKRKAEAPSILDPNIARNYPLSYSMNYQLHMLKLDAMRNQRPSRVLLLIHESRKTINDGLYLWYHNGKIVDIPSDVHYDGTTLSYCDGHTKWKNARTLVAEAEGLYWDPNSNRR